MEGFFPYRYRCPPSFLSTCKIEMSGSGSRKLRDNDADAITFTSQLQGSQSSSATTTTLIILNSPIFGSGSNGNGYSNPCFDKLWTQSHRRVCADGGANRLHKYNPALVPDLIRGDLDSLDPNVKAYYESRGVKIERDPCQDTNDLDKALQACCTNESNDRDKNTNSTRTTILIYGAFGGRFDQEMASMQALYKWGPKFSYQIYLYSDETCAFLLPGDHQQTHIRLPFYGDANPTLTASSSSSSMGEGPTCGLIPLGTKCDECVTDGLKWDLDATMPLEFGGLVSTSNRLMKPVVSIRASHPLVFTAELLPQHGR